MNQEPNIKAILSLYQMSKIERIENFYKRKLGWIPDNFQNQVGHFNVFKIERFVDENPKPTTYAKRNYFKVMLSLGQSKLILCRQRD